MKKITILLPMMLTACILPADKQLMKGATETPIVDTLELYKEYNNGSLGECSEPRQIYPSRINGSNVAVMLVGAMLPPFFILNSLMYWDTLDLTDYTVLAKQDVNLKCIYSEVVIAPEGCDAKYGRYDSKVCFFDYKKYLPENSEIKTDSDFLALASKYKKAGGEPADIEKELAAFINGGLSAKKTNDAKNAQKKEKERQEQAKEKRQQDEINIAYCEQAYKKASQKSRSLYGSDFLLMKDSAGCEYVVNSQGECKYVCTEGAPRVTDFAKKGVFIDDWAFVYTSDTDYANDDRIRHNNLVYKKVGNYKYKTVTGATRSVPAYEATQIKNYEIMLDSYLNDKKIACCQYRDNEKWEIGVVDSTSLRLRCKTKKHPNGKTGSQKCSF